MLSALRVLLGREGYGPPNYRQGCQEENMRLTIIAGLMVGVSLAIQSAHAVHLKASASQAAAAVSVHVSAPWYIAMNSGHSANALGTDSVAS
jgi:hypothetical protein